MAIKLLENAGIENTGIGASALNNLITGNKSGIVGNYLNECAFTATGNTIIIDKGLLIICGRQVEIDAIESITLSSLPSVDVRYQIVIELIREESGEVTASIFTRQPSTLIQENLLKDGFVYQFELGRVTHKTTGQVTEVLRTADILTAGGGGGADFEIGDVTTEMLAEGIPAEVDIEKRTEDDKTFLDFTFAIPKGDVVSFTEAAIRDNIATGEKTSTIFGKIKKWFADLKPHAFANPSTAQGTGTTTVPCDKLLTDSTCAAFYRNLTDSRLGLTTASDMIAVATAMIDFSVLEATVTSAYTNILPPVPVCKLRVEKHSVNRISAFATYKDSNVTTQYYFIGHIKLGDASNQWSGWEKILTDKVISTVMPISSAAASNEKVLGEKVVYDEVTKKANSANPILTGQIDHITSINKTLPIGVYQILAGDNVNYWKIMSVYHSTGINYWGISCKVIVFPYAADTNLQEYDFNIQVDSANTVKLNGFRRVDGSTYKIGNFYYTLDVTNTKFELYYKPSTNGAGIGFSIVSGYNHANRNFSFISDGTNTLPYNTGSTSAPTTPSGGYAGSFVYTDYKQIATTDNIAYDKIIRTQLEFEALIGDEDWLDAESVALVGQFTLDTANNSGIKIPATVKQIHGFNGAKITVTNFVYNSMTAKGGLWYDIRPTTPDYSIRDLEVDCTGTGAYGFSNCTNLTNCTGTGTGTGAVITNGIGFYDCTNLTNCTGTGTGAGTGAGNTNGFGFRYCTNLTNCTGTGTGAGTGSGNTNGFGFYDITTASNCKDGGSSTAMWGGVNKNINLETCRKTPVTANNTTLNT